MKKFNLKKYWIDITIILSLLVISLTAVLTLHFMGKTDNLTAEIYANNNIVETIKLNEEKEDPRYIYVDGLHGKVKIAIKKNAIAIVESNCPGQDCVHTGYISRTSQTSVCAYNAVYIKLLDGKPNYDIEV